MDILSLQFLTALLAIVVIDLVLAGDNAIVIALASRSLPRHLQKRAIMWGALGAIVVRSAMTLVVVWLLKIPGLLFLGGALLVWIAYGLLLPEADEGMEDRIKPAVGFWGAIRTIVVADMVMGLDNVLAVAGAAHGSYLLVVLGLLISVPIVVWGSTILLHWVERYPGIVYLGAGVLAWTAAKMILAEPYLRDLLEGNEAAAFLLYFALIGGVLWGGFVKNHRQLESRIRTRLAALARRIEAEENAQSAGNSPTDATVQTKGESPMFKVLVPIDGSRNAETAMRHAVESYARTPGVEFHLLNAQPPFSRHITQFVSRRNRDDFQRDEALKVLGPAKAFVEKFGVPCFTHYQVRAKANAIVEHAAKLDCKRIVMSTARKNSLTRMLEDSTTNKVLEMTTVPLELVAGDSVSNFERYGLPTGVGALLALMIAAAVD